MLILSLLQRLFFFSLFSFSSSFSLTLTSHHVVNGRYTYKEESTNNQKEKRKVAGFEWYIYNMKEDHLFYFLRGLIKNIHTLDIV